MLRNTIVISLLAPLCLSLAACTGSDVRQSLGMQRNQPDEFQVVSRPPLSVPPVYYLRPPVDGDAATGTAASAQARSLLLDGQELPHVPAGADHPGFASETAVTTVGESALRTHGDEAFLRSARSEKASADIRTVLNEENRPFIEEEKREKGFIDKLRPGSDEAEPVVDAAKERERILENKEAGKPVTEGDVPVVDSKTESTLDRLFK